MRTITVSTDVFAAIWADRRLGEDSEDDVLRRMLRLTKPEDKPLASAPREVGFRDARFGVEFREGFEIFRTFKGREYRAHATGGAWKLLNTGKSYGSLNRLSRAIGADVENAWKGWYYRGESGEQRLVTELRPEDATA